MSLPEVARWHHNNQPAPGTLEAEIMDAFQSPREWLQFNFLLIHASVNREFLHVAVKAP